MKKPLYFIALILPEPLQSEITALKYWFLNRFECKVALKSPAHITLIPPFTLLPENENSFIHHLNNFQSTINQIPIELNGFGHFDKRTIFVKPVANDLVNKLYAELNAYFELFEFAKSTAPKNKFNPHITIANRDLKKEDYAEAWKMFSEKEFITTCVFTSFFLLKHNGSNWDLLKEFAL